MPGKLMKYGILVLVTVLAMVTGIVAMVVVPADAQIGEVLVILSNNRASHTSLYQINLTGVSALTPGLDQIILEFPSESDVPSIIDGSKVTVDGVFCIPSNGSEVVVSDNEMLITVPLGFGGGGCVTVVIFQGAGIVNPEVSQETEPPDTALDEPYELKASTSMDPVASGTFAITDWITASDLTLYVDQPCTVNGGGFWPGSTVLFSGPISGSAMVGSNGNFTATAYGTGAPGTATATDGSGRVAQLGGFQVMPSISVSPDSGPVTKGVQISGMNFMNPTSAVPASPITLGTVMFGGTAWVAAGTVASIDSDTDGAFDDWSILVNVPRMAAAGWNQIQVPDPLAAGSPVATTQFEVDPRYVTVDPVSGFPGSSVTIQGIGWPPGEPGSFNDGAGYDHPYGGIAFMLYGNTTAGSRVASGIEVDTEGHFIVEGTIPYIPTPGVHCIVVFFDPTDDVYHRDDPQGDELVAQGYFIVNERSIMMSPSYGPFGVDMTVSGGGFGPPAAGTTAAVWINGQDTGLVLDLDSSGDIVPTIIPVTDDYFIVGQNEIRVVVADPYMTAAGFFEVRRPYIGLDLSKVVVRGSQITVEGAGWLPGGDPLHVVCILVDWGDGLGWDAIDMTVPDEQGEISTIFSIPRGLEICESDRLVLVMAMDLCGNYSLQHPFVVSAPGIITIPGFGSPSEIIAVQGTGFVPLAPVEYVRLSGAGIVRPEDLPVTDAQGSFAVSAAIPGLAPGNHTLTASVAQCEASTSFSVLAVPDPGFPIEECLVTIDGLYTTVWTFEAATQEWVVFKPDLPSWVDAIEVMVKGQGYWIKLTQDCVLNFGPYTYNLHEGWNLIGWLGL